MSEKQLDIVHTESSMGWGGQELRILTESEGMIRRGHNVRIVCPRDAKIFDAAAGRGIPVEPLPIRRRNFKAFGAVRQWLKNNRADVINTHSSTDSWLFSIAAKLFSPKTPTVRTRHIGAPVPRDFLTRWLYAKGARMVVACGSKLREALVRDNRIPDDHVISIPTGIDTTRFQPGSREEARRELNLPLDKQIVGIVATFRAGKGHKHLLDAVHQLARKDLMVLIVGDGPYREQIEQHIADLGLADQIVMPGNQHDVVPWLRAMDIFVLSSWAIEGVSQAVMQAMSCGVPVVATSVGSIADAVVHEETGIIVPPEDPPALAEALQKLLDDDVLRERFGRESRQRAAERFGIGRMIDCMEGAFLRVARAA